MPISGFDLKIKIRAIQKNFPFSFFSFFFFSKQLPFATKTSFFALHILYTQIIPSYIHVHILVIPNTYKYTSFTPLAISRARAKPLERRYTNEGLCVGLRLKRESSMTPRTLQDFPRAWVQVQGQVHRATCQSVLVTIGLPASLRTLKNRFHDRNLDSELHPLRRHSTFAG